MALSSADLETIETLLATDTGVTVLRRQFPHLAVTRCDESDIDTETPYRAWPHLSLYLVDGTDHCWRITTDPARATGVVVASRRTA